MVTDVMRASARQSFDRLSEMTVGEVARAVTTTEASPSAAAREAGFAPLQQIIGQRACRANHRSDRADRDARMPERYPSSNGRRQSWEGQSRQDRQRYHAGENGRQSAEHAVMRHAICEAGVRGQTGRPTAYCGRQDFSSLGSRAPWSANRVCPSSHAHLVTELRQSLRTDALDFQKLVDVVEPSYLRSIVEDALRGPVRRL